MAALIAPQVAPLGFAIFHFLGRERGVCSFNPTERGNDGGKRGEYPSDQAGARDQGDRLRLRSRLPRLAFVPSLSAKRVTPRV